MGKPTTYAELQKKFQKQQDARFGLLTRSYQLEVIPTGSIVLDKLSGVGGVPVARFTQIASEPGAGKSTSAISISASTQRLGGKVLYLDFEQTITPQYVEKLGCSLDESNPSMFLFQPTDIDVAWDLIVDCADAGLNLLVLDSVAAMFPRVDAENEKELRTMPGYQARALGPFLHRLKTLCRVKNFAVVMINQVRAKIEFGFGAGIQRTPAYSKELPGGWAPKFYTDLLFYLDVKKAEKNTGLNIMSGDQEDVYTGNIIKATVWKNKVGNPFTRGELYLNYGSGIDDTRSVMELGQKLGLISYKRTGHWSIANDGTHPNKKLKAGADFMTGRGTEDLKDQLMKDYDTFLWLRSRLQTAELVEAFDPNADPDAKVIDQLNKQEAEAVEV